MEQNKTFIYYIIGTDDYSYFLATIFFAFLGAFLSIVIHTTNRDKDSKDSPYNFEWEYMFRDNYKRICFNMKLVCFLPFA